MTANVELIFFAIGTLLGALFLGGLWFVLRMDVTADKKNKAHSLDKGSHGE